MIEGRIKNLLTFYRHYLTLSKGMHEESPFEIGRKEERLMLVESFIGDLEYILQEEQDDSCDPINSLE